MHAPEQLVAPITDPDWIYEIKHDGYRCMAGVEAGSVQLRTKSGADCTAWFPELVQALAQLPAVRTFDGEACVLREDGTSDFNLLQGRARRRRLYRGAPMVTLCAFDLLVRDGIDRMERPLLERKASLEELLAGLQGPPSCSWATCRPMPTCSGRWSVPCSDRGRRCQAQGLHLPAGGAQPGLAQDQAP